jgi:predicted nuclease of predicted toxin-antitoxin system
MKFLIDAQLPPSLKEIFTIKGFDCIHTIDLEKGNETPDKIINEISIAEDRILITKDSDFYTSFIIKKEPYKLILVKFGNSSRTEIIQFFNIHFEEIIKKIENESLILLTRKS